MTSAPGKPTAEIMALQWARWHVGGLASGEVECHRCRQIYRLGDKHDCKASEPER